jgi:TRAP-type transport system periplasmic protein
MRKTTVKSMLVMATVAVSLASAAAASAENLTITFAHVDPPQWQTSKKGAAALVFQKLVEAQSGGKIKVKLYPSGQLGGETQLVQSVQDGSLTMTMVSGAFTRVCPAASALQIPYMFPSAPIAWRVLDGPYGRKLAAHCLAKTGLRVLAYGETGFRDFTNNKHPIKSPKDMRGLKFRVQNVPLYVQLVKDLGGIPTPISWPETPNALATGVVDGEENPVSVINSNKFYKVQKYLTLDQHVYATDFILINNRFYEKLSPADKAMLLADAQIAGNAGRSIQEINSAIGLSHLIKEGMHVYQPTKAEMAEFREATQPAIEKWLAGRIDKSWITGLKQAVAEAEATQRAEIKN